MSPSALHLFVQLSEIVALRSLWGRGLTRSRGREGMNVDGIAKFLMVYRKLARIPK